MFYFRTVTLGSFCPRIIDIRIEKKVQKLKQGLKKSGVFRYIRIVLFRTVSCWHLQICTVSLLLPPDYDKLYSSDLRICAISLLAPLDYAKLHSSDPPNTHKFTSLTFWLRKASLFWPSKCLQIHFSHLLITQSSTPLIPWIRRVSLLAPSDYTKFQSSDPPYTHSFTLCFWKKS
jgi:hypothetical protein